MSVSLRRYFFCLIVLPVLSGCATLVRVPVSGGAGQTSGPPYRGVFHVHTVYSHDSKVSFDSLRRNARRAGLDFAVVADHNTAEGLKDPLASAKEPPLVIVGEEISTSAGHLISMGTGEKAPKGLPPAELMNWIHARDGYAVLAHPTSPRKRWSGPPDADYDGLEVYNFANSIYRASKWKLAFAGTFYLPAPFLRTFQGDFSPGVSMWDRRLADRASAAFGAADAHIHFKLLGFSPESLLLMLRSVTMYVYTDRLERRAIVDALGTGRSFIAFESRGSARGFYFRARRGENEYFPGSRLEAGSAVFEIHAPGPARLRLIRGGAVVTESGTGDLVYESGQPGVYRAEAYKGKNIWILANPIYVSGGNAGTGRNDAKGAALS